MATRQLTDPELAAERALRGCVDFTGHALAGILTVGQSVTLVDEMQARVMGPGSSPAEFHVGWMELDPDGGQFPVMATYACQIKVLGP